MKGGIPCIARVICTTYAVRKEKRIIFPKLYYTQKEENYEEWERV